MDMSFRWYGDDDAVTLDKIRQIPGVTGIVTAIYDVPPGEVWSFEKILALKEKVESKGFKISAIESVPVHEDIKTGDGDRDRYIENYCQTLRNLAKAGIDTVCYNFMPVFDWTRTDLAFKRPDGSTSLIYDEKDVEKMDPLSGELELPGWDTSYTKEGLRDLLNKYKSITKEDLWSNLEYFLKRVIKVADEVRVKMAIHPDDPPWDIFGIPRIICSKQDLERLCSIYDSPYNGITLCVGALGCAKSNDVVDMIYHFGKMGRVHFGHTRNIKLSGECSFKESGHRSEDGSLDMYAIMKAFSDIGFEGPIRPDHGRMIWGETGRPGYGLYDRALGATYLCGLWEAIKKNENK